MKKLLVICSVVLAIGSGCKGEKGDKGDPGIVGPSGSFELLSGAVTSNAFSVTDSRLGTASHVTVYIGSASELTELPYFLPGSGVNTYFIYKPLTDTVDIVNAQLAGASIYIVAISE